MNAAFPNSFSSGTRISFPSRAAWSAGSRKWSGRKARKANRIPAAQYSSVRECFLFTVILNELYPKR